jgi:uncharacterized protein Usg
MDRSVHWKPQAYVWNQYKVSSVILGPASSLVCVNVKDDLFVHYDMPDFMTVMASYVYAVRSMLCGNMHILDACKYLQDV